MKCEYGACAHQAIYFMSWWGNNNKKSGYVCATHDKNLGRKNLMTLANMTLSEAIEFERYAQGTED